jgi:hypothetical protein
MPVQFSESNPFFEPWVGRKYRGSSGRLLILGESHYGPPSMPGTSTVELTQEYVDGVWSHRFWTNIMQLVLGSPYREINRAEFWETVALYNYVQEPVAETHSVAPTPEMYEKARPAFYSVLRCLTPKLILVLSKRLWDNLPPDGRLGDEIRYGEANRETWIYPYDGGKALASWVPHPSWGFSWRRWHPLVTALLAESSKIS